MFVINFSLSQNVNKYFSPGVAVELPLNGGNVVVFSFVAAVHVERSRNKNTWISFICNKMSISLNN
jgi:hypothetical protein